MSRSAQRMSTWRRLRRNGFKKTDQIVRDVVHMSSIAALELPALAKDFAGSLRHHQHRRHAERVRDTQVAGKILEHRGVRRLDPMAEEEAVVGLRRRFWLQLGGDDVEHVLEMRV